MVGTGLKYTSNQFADANRGRADAVLPTRTPIMLTTITDTRLIRRMTIRRRAAKMDTARTVSRLSSIMEFSRLFSKLGRENAQADSLAAVWEPRSSKRVLKLLKWRSNISRGSFREVVCNLARQIFTVKRPEYFSAFFTGRLRRAERKFSVPHRNFANFSLSSRFFVPAYRQTQSFMLKYDPVI